LTDEIMKAAVSFIGFTVYYSMIFIYVCAGDRLLRAADHNTGTPCPWRRT